MPRGEFTSLIQLGDNNFYIGDRIFAFAWSCDTHKDILGNAIVRRHFLVDFSFNKALHDNKAPCRLSYILEEFRVAYLAR